MRVLWGGVPLVDQVLSKYSLEIWLEQCIALILYFPAINALQTSGSQEQHCRCSRGTGVQTLSAGAHCAGAQHHHQQNIYVLVHWHSATHCEANCTVN